MKRIQMVHRLVCAGLICLLVQPAVAQRFGSRNLRNSAPVKEAFEDIVAAATKSTVRILVDDKPVALGCIVSPKGEVLTKATLVTEGAVSLQFSDGKVVPAARGGTDKAFDVLLLTAESGSYAAMKFAEPSPGVGKLVACPSQDGKILSIGMVTFETSRPGLRRELPAPPPANSAYMGITLRPAGEKGIVVTTVAPNSPASKAGLMVGDTVLKVGDAEVNNQPELQRVLRGLKAGEKAKLKIVRKGENKDGEITFGRRPRNQQGGADRWGGGPFSTRRAAFPKVITHDSYIRPNDCGGPVVTSSGDIVGLNIARALRVATYAVPGDAIPGLVTKLREQSPATKAVAQKPAPAAKKDDPAKVTAPAAKKDDPAKATAPAAIRAAGIDGSLVLYTADPADDVFARFVDLARRDRAQIVAVSETANQSASIAKLKAAWTAAKGSTFHTITVSELGHANDQERLSVLEKATGVWIDGSLPLNILKKSKLADEINALQQRDGVVAGPAIRMAKLAIGDKQADGAGLLPDSVVSAAGSDPALVSVAMAAEPQLVNYHLSDHAALMVRGRFVFALGGSVEARFGKSKEWPDQNVVIEGREVADLTALRRVARRRTGPVFPPKSPEQPRVDKGTLIIVGGGGMPQGLAGRFVEEAGGKDAVIAVIPISMPRLPERDRMAEYFKSLGAKEVHVLKQRTPEESDSTEVLDILKKTTGVWFGGGRQWRFIDAYENTEAAKLLHGVLARGGVIGGSSAGASIQGDYMARGNPLGPRDIMADGYESGLKFLRGVAIDQHFTQRNRLPDMTSLMARYPQLLGIGIDETTAIVVKKNIAEVVGRHRVCFYDRKKPVPDEGPDFESVRQGGKYDLVARKVLNAGEPDPKAEKSEQPEKADAPKKDAPEKSGDKAAEKKPVGTAG